MASFKERKETWEHSKTSTNSKGFPENSVKTKSSCGFFIRTYEPESPPYEQLEPVFGVKNLTSSRSDFVKSTWYRHELIRKERLTIFLEKWKKWCDFVLEKWKISKKHAKAEDRQPYQELLRDLSQL